MPSAEINIDLGDEAKSYLRVMDKDIAFKRSKVTTSSKGGRITIKIVADDQIALVASMNSMLKQMLVISTVKDVVKGPKSGQR